MALRNNLVGGIVLGAGLMYLLDPERGRRRRAMVRDQMVSSWGDLDDAVDTAARDLKNRARGVVAETRSRLTPDRVTDEVLKERVRALIGRVVSHPHAIGVESKDKYITLSGPILADEEPTLISAVKGVRGVEGVVNHLEVHEEPGNVPGLQGSPKKPGPRVEVMQENWAPAFRFLMGIGGGLTTVYGLRIRGPIGSLVTLAGLGTLARSITNMRLSRLTGIGAGRRAVEVQKMINVNAPVEEVFEFWTHFENFPRFMSGVKQVRRLGDNRWYWVIEGPAGSDVGFEAETTQFIENERIAWKTVDGATVASSGVVKFLPNEKGVTCIDLHMSYNSLCGEVGSVLGRFYGVDARSRLNEDLLRFKSLIEEGKTSAHGEEVTREELGAFPAGFDHSEDVTGGDDLIQH